MDSAQPTVIDPREFRNCCGRFATGITVITTTVDDMVHGMTVNGFMSVSLAPPLIVISIARKTRMYELLSKSGYYGVSVLEESQERLSSHFAGRPDPTLDIVFINRHTGVPMLRDALAQMAARVVDAHPAGDHVLFIGQVEYVNYVDKHPLLYYMSDYNRLKSNPKQQYSIWFDDELTFYSPPAFEGR